MLLQIKLWIEASRGPALAYISSLGFLSGTALAFLFHIANVVPLILVGISTSAVLLGFAFRKPFFILLAAALCVSGALGIIRVQFLPDIHSPFVAFNNKAAIVIAHIIDDPEIRATGVQAKAEVLRIDSKEVSGVLLLRLPIGADISYGDTVLVRGKIELPKPFLTEEGREFDYPNYLRAKGVDAVMHSQFVNVTEAHPRSLFGALYDFKQAFMRLAERTLPEPESSLLEGMLLGNKDALSGSMRDAFVTAGLVHIVVLSGYNLTLVADVFMKVSSLILPRLAALTASALSIVLFACMAGLDATVVRASVMALIVIAAQALRRPSVIMRSLALACVVMVLYNPYVLVYDPSFILSFLATFGLVTLSGPVSQWLSRVPERFSFRDIAAATIATQAFVFPILVFYTGKFSIISLPANLLALPLVPYAMWTGFIATCTGLLGHMVSLPFAAVAWGLLSGIIYIAQFAAAIPFAAVDVSALQTPLLLLLYVLLGPLALYLWQANEKAKSKNSA